MKKSKIILLSIFTIVFGGLIYIVLNHSFERKIKVLDCEGVYHQKLFEKPKPGYLDFSQSNAKVDVANCLCEKYMKNKDTTYKKEILRFYKEHFGGMRLIIKNPEKNIDSICKYRNQIFIKMYDL
ncbi:hypothetical protein [Cloacibacterium sp.]|uniref:hypothetical protein n=1 Tax=Cloacibacterium sp. TaxID=1913682 RepID=UPI0039E61125